MESLSQKRNPSLQRAAFGRCTRDSSCRVCVRQTNRNFIVRRFLLLVLLLVTTTSFADDPAKLPRMVRNPAAEFLRSFQPLGPVLAIHYDFDGDGVEDVAYADRAGCGHHGNCGYEIFLRRAANRYVEVGNIVFWEHLRLRPRHNGQGGIVQTFMEGAMFTYVVSSRGVRSLPDKNNPLHYDLGTGEVAASDHVFKLAVTSYTLEEFTALASKSPPRLTTGPSELAPSSGR